MITVWLVSKPAADRIIDRLGPKLALEPRKRFGRGTVLGLARKLPPSLRILEAGVSAS